MKPFTCDAFIALEGDSGRRSDLHDKPSTERGWLVAIGDLDKCPCIGYRLMADRRSAWYQWVIESFDLARVDYYMKCYIRRPSWAPSRSIAHG